MINKSLEDRINKLNVKNSKSVEDVKLLESSIIRLTESYYMAFLINDSVIFEAIEEELKDLIETNISDYPNINNFVNYRLLKSIVPLLKKNLNIDIEVPIFNKVKIEEEPELIKYYHSDLVSEKVICSRVEGVEIIEKL